jgi:hypothetical protein
LFQWFFEALAPYWKGLKLQDVEGLGPHGKRSQRSSRSQLMFLPFHVFQKDDPDDSPIELSKVQSVKAVAKKRRDRSLPRAFEIFTDNKTYVFKAKDEKNAEEWLQCINVAVAQAKERESREVTTYL